MAQGRTPGQRPKSAGAHPASMSLDPPCYGSVCLNPITDLLAKSVRFCSTADVPVDIAYATHGDPSCPAMILCGDMGSQLVDWNDCFVAALARRFFVIRFDYRDAGNSTKMPHRGANLCAGVIGLCTTAEAPYTLHDVAADTWALVDRVVGYGAPAHLVGFGAFGGAVAQVACLTRMERVTSLSLINSTTGAKDLPGPESWVSTARSLAQGVSDPARRRAEMHRLVEARDTEFDETDVMEGIHRALARMPYPEGEARHKAALDYAAPRDAYWQKLADEHAAQRSAGGPSPDENKKTSAAAPTTPPVTIIHGALDGLVPPAHGERLAAVVPNATLTVVPKMAHAIDSNLARPVAENIAAVAVKAEAARRDAGKR